MLGLYRGLSKSPKRIIFQNKAAFSAVPSQHLESDLHYFARKKQIPVDLQTLMETGLGNNLDKMPADYKGTEREMVHMQVACFLHRELPVRLAHRACELEATPIMQESKFVQQVCTWYKQSFQELRECPLPTDLAKEKHFARVIDSIYERHSTTLITMAKGAHEIRSKLGQDIQSFAEQEDIQRNLDEFYLSRIGIRMLIGQYLALRQMDQNQDSDSNNDHMVGLISQKASPYLIAQEAIDNARYMCERQHGDAPEVLIVGRTDLTLPYVPSHISYILFELIKNSMRATVETHGIDNMPPIKIVIADDEANEDVAIKVSDEGGGIKRSHMDNVWSYMFTTADPEVLQRMIGDDSDIHDFATETPLAGLGYGLPIARNYARYFGGDLTLMSMEGYGTDTYVYLSRLGNKVHVLA